MNINYIILSLSIFIGLRGFSQDEWSLSKCVNYAIENNIELNQSYNQVELAKVDYFQSKMSLLPNIGADITATINYGRNIDEKNEVTYEQTLNNYYSIDASISLFQGLVKCNSIALNRYMLKAKKQSSEIEKNNLILQIMTSYYSVLYSNGLTEVAEKQMNLSEMQYNRMLKMVEVGRESPINAQEIKSQWADDRLSFIRAQNNSKTQLLELKQLLRISASLDFNVDTLDESSFVIKSMPEVDSIFNMASSLLPNIKYQELLAHAYQKDLAVAKGRVSPNFYASVGYYTYYYGTSGADNDPLSSQLKDQQNPYLGIGVSIPIFNGASKYSNIKQKQIALADQQLQIEKEKEGLYAEIWNALNDLLSAKNEYESSVELLGYSKLAFENTEKKMEKGIANATEFEASKQRYVSAEAGVLKARLLYVMRSQMIEFYLTGNWAHL